MRFLRVKEDFTFSKWDNDNMETEAVTMITSVFRTIPSERWLISSSIPLWVSERDIAIAIARTASKIRYRLKTEIGFTYPDLPTEIMRKDDEYSFDEDDVDEYPEQNLSPGEQSNAPSLEWKQNQRNFPTDPSHHAPDECKIIQERISNGHYIRSSNSIKDPLGNPYIDIC